MSARSGPGRALGLILKRVRGFWEYYRRYTTTAIHAAATAALTAFGLLIFIDPSFAWLAIASYVLPPVVLYAIGVDTGDDPSGGVGRSDGADRPTGTRAAVADGSDHDADSDGADADVDGPDADHDGIDRDADGPDLDHDGPDRDSDGPDADADGADGDADGPDLDRDG
ncbi:hypothetical protein [Halalkalicoccus subterraneus]|uniref:hypothetical protein n=1 Tax=Halalkalicoccus subterraneus TaxID=2675002 RepID=UPI000EFB985F|nr:hypothetical protein [Halalkalicoccus subterraneus]